MKRYALHVSETPNSWVLVDIINEYVITFENKRFNETQKIRSLNDEDPNDFMKIARILREAGEWLVENHPEKAY